MKPTIDKTSSGCAWLWPAALFALLVLSGCGSTPQYAYDPEAVATSAKYGQHRQECLNAGYGDHSQGYFDCMKERWQGRPDPVAKAQQDQTQVVAAVKQCDQLLAAKKLKSNYERGKCINAAFEKYASAHPPADKAAFETFQTDTLLIMVRLDKKEITNDEAQVLMRQSMNKLVQAEEAAIAQERQRQAAWEQQAYQAQVQQQQYENARSAAILQGFSDYLQNQRQQQQQRLPVTTRCNTFYGTTTCTTQ